MATIFQLQGEKIVATYGGGLLGMCFSSMMKVWNSWANLAELSLRYKYNRSPIERGVGFGLGWSCNISLMDSEIMVKRTFWS